MNPWSVFQDADAARRQGESLAPTPDVQPAAALPDEVPAPASEPLAPREASALPVSEVGDEQERGRVRERVTLVPRIPNVPETTLELKRYADIRDLANRLSAGWGDIGRLMRAIAEVESDSRALAYHIDGASYGPLGMLRGGEFDGFVASQPGLRMPQLGDPPLDPTPQLIYGLNRLRQLVATFGSVEAAARVWHRGVAKRNDAKGASYWAKVKPYYDDPSRIGRSVLLDEAAESTGVSLASATPSASLTGGGSTTGTMIGAAAGALFGLMNPALLPVTTAAGGYLGGAIESSGLGENVGRAVGRAFGLQ